MNRMRRLGDFFLLRIVIPFVSKGHNFVQLCTSLEVYSSFLSWPIMLRKFVSVYMFPLYLDSLNKKIWAQCNAKILLVLVLKNVSMISSLY